MYMFDQFCMYKHHNVQTYVYDCICIFKIQLYIYISHIIYTHYISYIHYIIIYYTYMQIRCVFPSVPSNSQLTHISRRCTPICTKKSSYDELWISHLISPRICVICGSWGSFIILLTTILKSHDGHRLSFDPDEWRNAKSEKFQASKAKQENHSLLTCEYGSILGNYFQNSMVDTVDTIDTHTSSRVNCHSY